jgi:hypothetical protein
VILAPKSYAYDVYSDKDPFAPQPLYSEVKMKGISLRRTLKASLTTSILEKLALGTLKPTDTGKFYHDLDEAMQKESCTDVAKEGPLNSAATTTTSLTLPQPRLTKSRAEYKIYSNAAYTKTLSARFEKRLLQQVIVHKDMATENDEFNNDPFHESHYPSLPYGFQSGYLGNA